MKYLLICLFLCSCTPTYVGHNTWITDDQNVDLNKLNVAMYKQIRAEGTTNLTYCQTKANMVVNELLQAGHARNRIYYIVGYCGLAGHMAVVFDDWLIDWPVVTSLNNDRFTWCRIKRVDWDGFKNCYVKDGRVIYNGR